MSTRGSSVSCWRTPVWPERSTPRSSAATARRGSSTISTWTIWRRIDGCGDSLGSHAAALLRDLRPAFDRRDPPRRCDRHLRYQGFRGEAQSPPFRRSVVSWCLDQPLSARRLPGEMRDRRDTRRALCQKADPSQDSDYDRRHELRLAFGPGQGGARARRFDCGYVHDHRGWRHDRRGTTELEDFGLPDAALALRHEPGPFA